LSRRSIDHLGCSIIAASLLRLQRVERGLHLGDLTLQLG